MLLTSEIPSSLASKNGRESFRHRKDSMETMASKAKGAVGHCIQLKVELRQRPKKTFKPCGFILNYGLGGCPSCSAFFPVLIGAFDKCGKLCGIKSLIPGIAGIAAWRIFKVAISLYWGFPFSFPVLVISGWWLDLNPFAKSKSTCFGLSTWENQTKITDSSVLFPSLAICLLSIEMTPFFLLATISPFLLVHSS